MLCEYKTGAKLTASSLKDSWEQYGSIKRMFLFWTYWVSRWKICHL